MQESNTSFSEALAHVSCVDTYIYSKFFQNIGATATTGHRTVAVFSNNDTSPCRYEGGHGRDVESVSPISSGPTGVDNGYAFRSIYPGRFFAKHRGGD